ncbi:MAG: hypothetical protein ABFD52_04220 [Acidobacteriota bacterium]
MTRRVPEILLTALLAGLAFLAAGCDPEGRSWIEPEDLEVKVLSGAMFVRTSRGDYVDGFLAEYTKDFETRRMFMAMEITRYVKGERLAVTGRFAGGSVRLAPGERARETVPVFEVERAAPRVSKAPDLPPRR